MRHSSVFVSYQVSVFPFTVSNNRPEERGFKSDRSQVGRQTTITILTLPSLTDIISNIYYISVTAGNTNVVIVVWRPTLLHLGDEYLETTERQQISFHGLRELNWKG